MAKDKITEYDATANNNTVCGDVNIAENSALPSDMNNFAREIMSHLKEGLGSGTPLYVDQTNNRLGINTSSPSVDLDISGGLSVDGGTIKLDGNYPTASNNVALGNFALDDGSLSGNANTAIGSSSMTANTSGQKNVGLGESALLSNTTGSFNTALGQASLESNTTASFNVAVGMNALTTNTTGASNSALGMQALRYNTTGGNNTAVGQNALTANTTGTSIVAVGQGALLSNTTGDSNTAVGRNAGNATTTATNSTYIGKGNGSLTTGSSNTFLGSGTGNLITTGQKNTIIGRFNGNQGNLDIRTSDNNIVLSDGDGNPNLIVSPNGFTKLNNQYATGINTSGNFHEIISTTNGSDVAAFKHYGGSSTYGISVLFTDLSPDNNTNYFFNAEDSTTARFRVYSDGDVQNHDNSYGAISDIKLKEQITDASSQWDDIKALTVRKYKMKSDVANGDSDAHWRLGLIAQEVETAGMNGLVKTNPDMTENEDGEMVDSGTTTKSIKYSILYMKAVKALQEAMERIETLESKVTALENG